MLLRRTWSLPRPSRTTVGVSLTLTALLGGIVCDQQLTRATRSEYLAEARRVAAQPHPAHAPVPKLVLLYAKPHPDASAALAKRCIDEYLKPVLDAAAVDYELVHGSAPGDLRAYVSAHWSTAPAHVYGYIAVGAHAYAELLEGVRDTPPPPPPTPPASRWWPRTATTARPPPPAPAEPLRPALACVPYPHLSAPARFLRRRTLLRTYAAHALVMARGDTCAVPTLRAKTPALVPAKLSSATDAGASSAWQGAFGAVDVLVEQPVRVFHLPTPERA